MILNIDLTETLLAEAFMLSTEPSISIEEIQVPLADGKVDGGTKVAAALWEQLKQRFLTVNRRGTTSYQRELAAAKALVRTSLNKNRQHADRISATLRGYISAFQGQLVQVMSRQLLPQTLELQKERLFVDHVSLSFEFSISGDLEASITRLFKIAASGKVSMSAAYRRRNETTQES